VGATWRSLREPSASRKCAGWGNAWANHRERSSSTMIVSKSETVDEAGSPDVVAGETKGWAVAPGERRGYHAHPEENTDRGRDAVCCAKWESQSRPQAVPMTSLQRVVPMRYGCLHSAVAMCVYVRSLGRNPDSTKLAGRCDQSWFYWTTMEAT
jgi:hypothetical protein